MSIVSIEEKPPNKPELHIFVGCPRDVQENEKQAVRRIVSDLDNSKEFGYRLIIHSSEDVPPGIGSTAQNVIDQFLNLKDQTHIFIFILWHRIGTPYVDPNTDVEYPSGTAYEFQIAYAKWLQEPESDKQTQIMLYRREGSPARLADIDVEQHRGVRDFFDNCPKEILYHQYDTEENFVKVFSQHISARIREFETGQPSRYPTLPVLEPNTDTEEAPTQQTIPKLPPTDQIVTQIAKGSNQLLTFEEWQRSFEASNALFEFQTDNTREQFTNQIKDAVLDQVNNTFHILHGSHGVGKTRLAMEAVRTAEVEAYTLYASSPLALVHNFFRQIPEALERLVLVVDNCDAKAVSFLKQQSLIHAYPIVFLTISSDPVFFSEIDNLDVFRLPPIYSEARSRFWRELAPEYDDNEELYWKLELEVGGNLKLAAAVAREFSSGETFIGLAQIVQRRQVRLLLESYIENEEEHSILQALSLLDRIGVHGHIRNEGEAIAHFVDISHKRFQLVTERLTRKRLVYVEEYSQGRYRVAIPLLAILLAEEAWQAWEPERIVQELIIRDGLPNKYAKARLISQLAGLGSHDLANKAVGHNLRSEDDELRLDDFIEPDEAMWFAALAEAAPDLMIPRLEKLVTDASLEQLAQIDQSRSSLVPMLQEMLYLSSTFEPAAFILRRLAEAENENFGNNASHVWGEIFYLRLGHGPVSAWEKFKLVENALDSDEVPAKLMGIKALEHVLSNREGRALSYGPGGYIVPPRWRPETWKEFWEIRQEALRLLDQTIDDGDEKVSATALRALANSARDQIGIVDDILEIFRRREFSTWEEKNLAWTALHQIREYDSEKLSSEQRERIEVLSSNLITESFSDQLRRWVGRENWDSDRSQLSVEIDRLAQRAMDQPELFTPDVTWVQSKDAMHPYVQRFGLALGRLDTEEQWLQVLIDAKQPDSLPQFIAGYLWGLAEARPEEIERRLDEWAASQELPEVVFWTTWLLGGSQRGVERVVSMLASQSITPHFAAQLMAGGWLEPIDTDSFKLLFYQLFPTSDPKVAVTVLDLLHMWLRSHMANADEVWDEARQLLAHENYEGRAFGNWEYDWEAIGKIYAESRPVDIANLVLAQIGGESFLHRLERHTAVLNVALLANPSAVWELIAPVFLKEAFLIYGHSELDIENEPIRSLVLEWAEKNKPEAPIQLAQVAHIEESPLPELARQLLIRFEDIQEVTDQLRPARRGMSWSGSKANAYQERLERARGWLEDKEPAVQNWAKGIIRYYEQKLIEARSQEDMGFFA